MLLCAIQDVRPGMILGSQVRDPRAPDLQLLRPGVVLDAALLASIRKRGVSQVWVEDDLTRDLDAALAPELSAARLEVYARLRDDLSSMSRRTLSVASVQSYRQAVMGLVVQAISSKKYAAMTDSLFDSDGLATHSSNVAYLSLICGLHLEGYVVSEQRRLSHEQARDMAVLGMAGLMHDLGKARFRGSASDTHEIHIDGGVGPDGYRDHGWLGHRMLSETRVPARVAHAALNHHQRFDGHGWPDLTRSSGGRVNGPLAGRRIHIFARIVSAANVLDNLMRDASGSRRPPVAALHAFASSRFDGWFDPLVRRAMLLRIPPYAIGTEVTLIDGRRCVVMSPNPERPCRPVVRVLAGASGERPRETMNVDLADETVEKRGVSITHSLGEDVSAYVYDVPAAPHPALMQDNGGDELGQNRSVAA
ncbi:MAG: HD domain-containing protein [Phycisphaeraceae bacterium]|nr:HD domain-containing protein [Phycisphaeraceae bacterium]MBX3366273.1 HD domain-containing protein [Phycisphaeraceae bacterium]QYK48729.1 MAG: HD domain-containing protein [Phycisphaeraceae bacterium]